MCAGKVSQTLILVFYKPDWPYDLTTQTLYEVINQVSFSVQDRLRYSRFHSTAIAFKLKQFYFAQFTLAVHS